MKFSFSGHVFRRMAERGFSPDTIKSVIKNGTVIKEYPDDTPYPSRLILGFEGNVLFMSFLRIILQTTLNM